MTQSDYDTDSGERSLETGTGSGRVIRVPFRAAKEEPQRRVQFLLTRVARVHRWVGALSALFVVSLAVTGVLLNHPELFGVRPDRTRSLAANPMDADHLLRGTDDGLQQSFDAGVTWAEVPMLFIAERAVDIVFAPGRSEVVYVVLEELGLLRSEDGGIVWERVDLGFVPIVEGVRLRRLAVGGDGSLSLWTSRGLLRSTDGGSTWQTAGAGGSNGPDFYRIVHQIHSGYYFSNWFRYLHDAAGVGLVILVGSGFVIWRGRSIRRRARRGTGAR